MKQYILFPEIMGSDQLLHLDGRWGMYRIKAAVKECLHRKRFVMPRVTRAQLCRGPLRNPTIIREFDV